MLYECTKERFAKDVATHEMKVVRDDGVFRFVRFKRPESSTYWFDLTTWPGHLCISGDMGTYVFSRLQDMFEFFGDEQERINPGYWGEKLKSICPSGGYREFDEKYFRSRVTEQFEDWWEDTKNHEDKARCWEEISDALATLDGEMESYNWVHEYEYRYADGCRFSGRCFSFQDFFDGGGTNRYTFHYIWALRAIVWGIKQYNDAKQTNV